MFTRRRPVAPELDLLTAKLAALMPFGKAAAFLAELLPMQAGTNASTVRNRTRHVGKRLERRARRQDQAAAADRAAARHDAAPPRALMIEPGPAVVTPAGPEAVLSLDGAYLRSRHPRPEKTFEVVVAKLRQPEGRVSHVAFAGTESLGAERVRRLVRGAHLKEGTSLIALSDGAANLRALQRQGAPRALHLLDWFHLAMRFERLLTAARALPDPEPNSPVDMRAWSEDLVRRAKWALWHGQSRKTRGHLEDLCGWTQAKQNSLAASGVTAGVHAVVGRLGRELLDYLWVNRYALPDYGERHRAGRPIASSAAESAVNAVVAKRMNKTQQMRWNRYTAEPFLTVRTHVVDGTLEPTFWKTYPGHRQKTAAAASTS